jgi:hypothetical protein
MKENFELEEGRHGRERMVAGFTTTYGISAYHHSSCEFKSHSGSNSLKRKLELLITSVNFNYKCM